MDEMDVDDETAERESKIDLVSIVKDVVEGYGPATAWEVAQVVARRAKFPSEEAVAKVKGVISSTNLDIHVCGDYLVEESFVTEKIASMIKVVADRNQADRDQALTMNEMVEAVCKNDRHVERGPVLATCTFISEKRLGRLTGVKLHEGRFVPACP
jgi:hypothetical protein